MAKKSTHHLPRKLRLRKVKEVARDEVGIEVLKEEHRQMERWWRPKMMIVLWTANHEPIEIISDTEVKEKWILHRIRVIPRNLQLSLLLRMNPDPKLWNSRRCPRQIMNHLLQKLPPLLAEVLRRNSRAIQYARQHHRNLHRVVCKQWYQRFSCQISKLNRNEDTHNASSSPSCHNHYCNSNNHSSSNSKIKTFHQPSLWQLYHAAVRTCLSVFLKRCHTN